MGGLWSKQEEEDVDDESKRVSSVQARATEQEERAWLDAMSRQNSQAIQYGKKQLEPEKPVVKSPSTAQLLDVHVIFVVGGPGSGKGTNCTRLSEEFNLSHLSVGDLLRNEALKGSERGKLLDEYMKEGKIVPMEITLEVVRSAILEHQGKAGFLIDGFPRKLDQAIEFEEKVAKCKFVLYFECSEGEMIKRLMERGKTSGRIDDNEETIKKRLQTFRDTSFPVIEYYQKTGKVRTVSSEREVHIVYQDAHQILLESGFNADPTKVKRDASNQVDLGSQAEEIARDAAGENS